MCSYTCLYCKCCSYTLSIFYRYYDRHCSSALQDMVGVAVTEHLYTVDAGHPRTVRFACPFFPQTAKLWNSLPGCAFPDKYSMASFKINIKMKILILTSPPLAPAVVIHQICNSVDHAEGRRRLREICHCWLEPFAKLKKKLQAIKHHAKWCRV